MPDTGIICVPKGEYSVGDILKVVAVSDASDGIIEGMDELSVKKIQAPPQKNVVKSEKYKNFY